MYFRLTFICLLAATGLILTVFLYGAHSPDKCNRATRFGLWYWAGVTPIAGKIESSDNLYLHQGSVVSSKSNANDLKFINLGISPHKLPEHRYTYLVYRLDKLGLADRVIDAFKTDVYQWGLRGNSIQGIQLDFDSPTHNLLSYIEFLTEFRKHLPETFKLSVTGLADWPATGDADDIRMIGNSSDEIIFQLYSGKASVKNLHLYLSKFSNLPIDFKLGVLESMDTCSEDFEQVYRNNHFKGFVYFLVNKDLETST